MANDLLLSAASGFSRGLTDVLIPALQEKRRFRNELELLRERGKQSRETADEERRSRFITPPQSLAEGLKLTPGEAVAPEVLSAAGTFRGQELSAAESQRRFKPKVAISDKRFIQLEEAGKLDPNVEYDVTKTEGSGETDKVQKRQDEGARKAVELVKNYYTSLRSLQGGRDVGALKSFGKGAKSLTAKIPITGRAFQPETSQLNAFRSSQGARLAKAFGDAGNIAYREQKNALEILAPLGTRNVDTAESQALTIALEGITNRTPAEEELLQRVKGAFDMQSPRNRTDVLKSPPPGLSVGEEFQGSKILSIKQIK